MIMENVIENNEEKINFIENDVLGRGSKCQVPSIVYNGFFGKLKAAIKIASHQKYVKFENLDIECLKRICHSNLVRIFYIERRDTAYHIAMEKCDINYEDMLFSKDRKIQMLRRKLDCFNVIRHILSGTEYLHKNEIVHGHINPRNVMICIASRCAKLSDYGFENLEKELASFDY